MTLTPGTGSAQLDAKSSEIGKPYVVVTADCDSPREIDDGLFVNRIEGSRLYRVGVCVADTSEVYLDPDIRAEALCNLQARYRTARGGEPDYAPMIKPEIIRDLELAQGTVRDALIVSFTVGKTVAPSEVSIDFGKVEVRQNLSYGELGRHARQGAEFAKIAQVSEFIARHLKIAMGGDPYDLLTKSSISTAKEQYLGSGIVKAYTAGANHLVGRIMAAEKRMALYRIHNPDVPYLDGALPRGYAWYATVPGQHVGLGLDPYCRSTSPLWRVEDFVMSHLLKQRHLGVPISNEHQAFAKTTVDALNERALQTSVSTRLRQAKQTAQVA